MQIFMRYFFFCFQLDKRFFHRLKDDVRSVHLFVIIFVLIMAAKALELTRIERQTTIDIFCKILMHLIINHLF